MPFTPYHFGPNAFIGLIFRRWLDVPLIVLANVAVDIEVLVISYLGLGRPVHRYAHTLLIGTAVGLVFGLMMFPFRRIIKYFMNLIHLPYTTSLSKMIFSGILGAWLHVLVDSFTHYDVKPFWPSKATPLFRLLNPHQVHILCLIFIFLSIAIYTGILIKQIKKHKRQHIEIPKKPAPVKP